MNIGLLDHMGYGNLGDAATQDAVITNVLRRSPGARIVGFSLVPEDTTQRHGIPCYPIRRRDSVPDNSVDYIPSRSSRRNINSKLKERLKRNRLIFTLGRPISQFWREALFWISSYRVLRTLDLVIISGGGQLDDLWPDQPYTLFAFALLTRLAGKKLYLLNVGVGPLKRAADRVFAKLVASLAHYRSVRDRDSQERLMEFGVKAEIHVYPDLVYSLDVEAIIEQPLNNSGRPTVGLNPCGFCDPRIWPRKDEVVYNEYIDKLFHFCVWLLETGYNLQLFSTDLGVDKYAMEDLKARLGSRLTSPQIFDESDGVKEILGEVASFDAVVTSKFHGIIFSHLLEKPVISLSYHRKMDRAMEAVGQGDFCADIEHFDGEWLRKRFSLLFAQSKTIKRQHTAAVAKNAAKLSHQFDGLFRSSSHEKPRVSDYVVGEGVENCERYHETGVGN